METMKKITLGLFLRIEFPLLGDAERLLAMRQYGSDWQGDYSPRNGRVIPVCLQHVPKPVCSGMASAWAFCNERRPW